MTVVESLEVIDIEHEDGERQPAPCGAHQFAFQRDFQVAPVEQAGQGIADRLRAQRLLQAQVRQRKSQLLAGGHRDTALRRIRRLRTIERQHADHFALRR